MNTIINMIAIDKKIKIHFFIFLIGLRIIKILLCSVLLTLHSFDYYFYLSKDKDARIRTSNPRINNIPCDIIICSVRDSNPGHSLSFKG